MVGGKKMGRGLQCTVQQPCAAVLSALTFGRDVDRYGEEALRGLVSDHTLLLTRVRTLGKELVRLAATHGKGRHHV